MKKRRFLAACLAAALLVGTKILHPDLANGVRRKLTETFAADEGYAAVRELFGVQTAENTQQAAAQPQVLPVLAAEEKMPETAAARVPTQAQYVSYKIEESAAAQTQNEAEPAPTEPPLPAAVAAFLESQAAFADYALPENADYTYTALPFEHLPPVSGRNSSGFGYRVHPIQNVVKFHFGTDFAANAGETVTAFADGTVTYAGYDDSYGWRVELDHGDGWKTLYAHCSMLYVSAGQQVARGNCVALVGATGFATGPHLHFELLHDGVYLNPEYYING